MFYSHEILTSRQYGVSTIWLVATIGNSNARKVTRKAIQEVDIQKACGKILEPGAPIALRLQGNLLYGVSRVHNQQCTYLVTDAKRIQDQMRLFFKAFPDNQIDPEAGKARPENLLIEDDPAFDPNMPLPQFEFETMTSSWVGTMKTSSLMSPFRSSQRSQSSSRRSLPIQLDLDCSSSSGQRATPLGLQGLSSAQKPDNELLTLPQEDDAFGAQGDWGLEIDENGNIIESAGPMIVEDEPQLPPLPPVPDEDKAPAEEMHMTQEPMVDMEGDVIMQEEPLPEAMPFPEREQHTAFQNDHRPEPRALKRGKKRKFQFENETQISRSVLRQWQTSYLELCGGYSARPVSAAQAKKNAMLLTFGLGAGNIGQNLGVAGLVHPLAIDYSGDILFSSITGIEVKKPRGKRRSASEALEDDEQEKGRNVKPRLMQNKEAQGQGGNIEEDDFMNIDDPLADETLPETGREAQQPMSDHLSSALLPWNRGSSAVPGSAIRAPNPSQRGRDLSSPSNKHRDPLDIVRYSDDEPMGGGFGSDGNFGGGFGSADHSFDGMSALGGPGSEANLGPTTEDIQSQNQHLFSQLDREGLNFRSFIREAVIEHGEHRRDDDFDMNRKWVAFNDIFLPRTTPRSTAAQAFYQTLCLTTKANMYVEQDGEINEPFGEIWIGLEATAEA